MITKQELESILKDQENMKSKIEEADIKYKKLEEENVKMKSSISGNRADSDEAKVLRYFSISNPKQLLGINIADQKFAGVPDHVKHIALDFKKTIDIARMTAQMFHGAPLDARSDEADPVSVKNIMDTYYGKNVLAPKLKAFGSTVVGGGDEWVPTGVSSSYIEEYLLERVLEQRFRQTNMPTNPYEMPTIKAGTKARKATEGVIGTGGQFQTDKITLSATKLYEYYEIPEELDEDSAPDILGAARNEIILAQKNAVETAIINGATGVHIDSDTEAGAADLAERIWDGLRHEALGNSGNGATSDFSNAIVDDTKLAVLKTKAGKYGVNPREGLWIVGPTVWAQMLRLANVVTMDKFGPQATVQTGTLGNYMGSPVLCSEYMREDLNATGVYDGVTTTRAGVIYVNTTRWYVGNRRPIQVKLMMDLPYHDRWLMASYRRVAFKGFAQGAVEKSVVYGYNVAK